MGSRALVCVTWSSGHLHSDHGVPREPDVMCVCVFWVHPPTKPFFHFSAVEQQGSGREKPTRGKIYKKDAREVTAFLPH
jgi:hypothetical protein